MMNEFDKYRQMKSAGATSEDVYRAARADGKDDIVCTRLMRDLFKLSLSEAKEILMAEYTDTTRGQRQDDLASIIEKALSDEASDQGNETNQKQE
jgi:hypothetical protein